MALTDYISSLDGPGIDRALEDMAQHTSEAYAIGERNGVPVTSGDPTYENNAKYWADISKAVSANGGKISDPDNDGHLIITTPSPSDDWAVRVDSPQTLTDAEKSQARANIQAGATNPNLLDNPWFTINQRNTWTITKSTGDANVRDYTVDRWLVTNSRIGTSVFAKNSDGTVTLDNSTNTSGYFYLVNILDEVTRNAIEGKTITMSALFSDGTVLSGSAEFHNGTSTTFASGTNAHLRMYSPSTSRTEFTVDVVPGASVTLKACKLEIGAYSTLANDVAPNYAEELLKCQRYLVRYAFDSAVGAIGMAYAHTTTNATAIVFLPVPMVSTPSLSVANSIALQNGVVRYNLTNPTGPILYGNVLTFTSPYAVSNGSAAAGTTGALLLRENAILLISAEPLQ